MRTQTLVIIALVAAASTIHAQENPDSLRQSRKGPSTTIAIGIGLSTLDPSTPLVIFSATHRAQYIVAKLQLRQLSDEAIRGESNIGLIDIMSANAMIGLSMKAFGSVTASITGGVGYRWGVRRGKHVSDAIWYKTERGGIDFSFESGFTRGYVQVPHVFATYEADEVSEIVIPFEAGLTYRLSRNIDLTLSGFGAYGDGSFDDCGVSASLGVGW